MNTTTNIFNGTPLGTHYFDPQFWFGKETSFFTKLFHAIFNQQTADTVTIIISVLCIFFIAVIFYTIIRLLEIRKKQHHHMHMEIEEYAHNKAEYEKHLHEQSGGSKNERWSIVLNYVFSQNSSDWKLAIIEADSMLGDLLSQLGFAGESIGDQLKSADQTSFPQLTNAWEIHTIRNRIAHDGMAFDLSQHEAKRVIAIYEDIFRVYGFI